MRRRGFTLIELLIAITVMAIMALISWHALDGMVRAREHTHAHADAVLTLQAALAQWNADLDAITDLPQTRPLDWNGRVLRLTRQSSSPQSGDVFVVAWSSDGRTWWRWQSAPVSSRIDWQQAWDAAASWMPGSAGNNAASTTALIPITDWQIYAFRNNVWEPIIVAPVTPPVDAAATNTTTNAAPRVASVIPNGLRLVLDLAPGPSLHGRITRDWVCPATTMERPSS